MNKFLECENKKRFDYYNNNGNYVCIPCNSNCESCVTNIWSLAPIEICEKCSQGYELLKGICYKMVF